MRANSAAVNSPYPTTSSLAGRVQGAVAERSTWTPAPPAATSTTLHWPVVISAAASRTAGIPICVGRLVHGPRPSSRAICAQSAPTTPSTSRGAMPASSSAPNAPVSAMEVESCSGRTRAWTVLWTPTMATSANGCGDWRVTDGWFRSAPLDARGLLSHCCAAGAAAGEDSHASGKLRAPIRPRPPLACAAVGGETGGSRSVGGAGGWVNRGLRSGEQQAPSFAPTSAGSGPDRDGAGSFAHVGYTFRRRRCAWSRYRLDALP